MADTKTVPCPRCQQPAVFAPANKWRPFCSERCRMIDLGQWASESYRVKTNEAPETPDAPDSSTPKPPGS